MTGECREPLLTRGFSGFRFLRDDLRHTFGTAMAAAGVRMRTLQEWTGHRDVETTQRYADCAPRTRDAELVAAAFRRNAQRKTDQVEAPISATRLYQRPMM